MKRYLIILSFLMAASCTEMLTYIEQPEENNVALETKASDNTTYYWYKGKKIPLRLNLQYANIIIDESDKKDTLFRRVSEISDPDMEIAEKGNGFIKIKLKESARGIKDYKTLVSEIKDRWNLGGIYPYYEQGEGVDPIGTSDLFYVRLKDNDKESLEKMAEKYRVKIVEEVPYMPEWYTLSVMGSDLENSINATNIFYESGLFDDIDPAFMFDFKTCTVNDPLFSNQWGINNTTFPGYDINVEGAWNITRGDGVNIAIIDTGVDNNHNELTHSFTNYSYNADDDSSPSVFDTDQDHGTHVAGIMVAKANNNHQIAGIADEAKLIRISHSMLLKVNTATELASGISWAWQHDADVINCSWGDEDEDSLLHSALLESALINAMTLGRSGKGTVIVFAAGNDGYQGPNIGYPANFDDRILTVGGTHNIGLREPNSGYGDKLDVVAPGNTILSTLPNNSTGYKTGTSVAAPHVSAIAALVLSVNPNLTREEVVFIIEQTAREIRPEFYTYYPDTYYKDFGRKNDELGHGLVDATMAVNVAQRFGVTPPSSSPGMDYYVTYGAAANYDGWFVMGNNTNAKVYFSLRSPQINSSYSYFWRISTSGDYGWTPTFDNILNDTQVVIDIPRPSYDSVLTVSCEIFNGSTYVCTATIPITVRLNFP